MLLPGIEPQQVEELLTRPVGRPSRRPVVRYKGFLYRAASWSTAPRVTAKVEFHAGELFSRVGFIVTNLELPSRAVVLFSTSGHGGAMDKVEIQRWQVFQSFGVRRIGR